MNWLSAVRDKLTMLLATAAVERRHGKSPQMAVISGDYVSLKAMLQGRFEDRELSVLEQHLFPHLKTRKCCLDIGANIGNHSVAFSRTFDSVIAFEPNPMAYDILAVNAKWNPGITALPVGASDHEHTARALFPGTNIGAAKIVATDATHDAGRSVSFRCVRVDEILPVDQFADVGFIKVDVEGHEYEALLGCRQILEAARPAIAFELLREDHDRNAQRIETYLKGLGYERYFELKAGGLAHVDRIRKKNYKMLIATAA